MDGPPGVACMDTRHPRRLLAPEQVLMRFSIIYDRPSISSVAPTWGRPGIMDIYTFQGCLPEASRCRPVACGQFQDSQGSHGYFGGYHPLSINKHCRWRAGSPEEPPNGELLVQHHRGV